MQFYGLVMGILVISVIGMLYILFFSKWRFKKIPYIFWCLLIFLLISLFINEVYRSLLGDLEIIRLDSLKNNKPINYGDLGPFGDYVGGLLNPLVAFLAVLFTGAAFFTQYLANVQINSQFLNQENKDYEGNFKEQIYTLLGYHSNSVNCIVINIVLDINQRDWKTLNQLFEEYPYGDSHIINDNLIDQFQNKDYLLKNRYAFKFYIELFKEIDILVNKSQSLKPEKFLIKKPEEVLQKTKTIEFKKFVNDSFKKTTINNMKVFLKDIDISLTSLNMVFFHYISNLKLILEVIDTFELKLDKGNDYNFKYQYVSILRAQLSREELMFLFIRGFFDKEIKRFSEKYTLFLDLKKHDDYFVKKYGGFYDKNAFTRY